MLAAVVAPDSSLPLTAACLNASAGDCGDPSPNANSGDPNSNANTPNANQQGSCPQGTLICGPNGPVDATVTFCTDSGSCVNATQIIVNSSEDVPLNNSALQVFSQAYQDVPFADAFTYKPHFPENICTAGDYTLGALGLATVINPEIFEVTGPAAAITGTILLIGCS